MIKNLTYKQQFAVYLGVIFVGLVLVFQVAIKPTLDLRSVCKEKELVLETVSTAPQQINAIQSQLNTINNQFQVLSFEENTSRDRILEAISAYCAKNRLLVFNYPEIHQFDNKTFTIESNSIKIRGGFKNLLKLVNYLESKADYGRIVSLSFKSELNRKTKRKELYLELIFQNIINNE